MLALDAKKKLIIQTIPKIKILKNENKQPFEFYQVEAIQIIDKRRAKWVLTTLPWEDVRQLLLTRLWKKFHLYDQNRPFENWANFTISNAIKNLLRDNCYKFQRPCLKCVFNQGDKTCRFTASKNQDISCPLYAEWYKKKSDLFNIKVPVAIDNHIQAVSNIQSDFIDIASAKNIIDSKILNKLEAFIEKRMYKLLFVQNKSPEEVGAILKLKNHTTSGLLEINNFKKKVVEMAKVVIKEEDLA